MSCALCMDIAMTVCDSQVLPAWRSTGQASTSLPAPASSFLPSSVQHSGVTDTNMQAPLTVATSSNTGSGAASGGAILRICWISDSTHVSAPPLQPCTDADSSSSSADLAAASSDSSQPAVTADSHIFEPAVQHSTEAPEVAPAAVSLSHGLDAGSSSSSSSNDGADSVSARPSSSSSGEACEAVHATRSHTPFTWLLPDDYNIRYSCQYVPEAVSPFEDPPSPRPQNTPSSQPNQFAAQASASGGDTAGSGQTAMPQIRWASWDDKPASWRPPPGAGFGAEDTTSSDAETSRRADALEAASGSTDTYGATPAGSSQPHQSHRFGAGVRTGRTHPAHSHAQSQAEETSASGSGAGAADGPTSAARNAFNISVDGTASGSKSSAASAEQQAHRIPMSSWVKVMIRMHKRRQAAASQTG